MYSFSIASENKTNLPQNIQSEIEYGRIMGPFSHRPISNLRCSSIGIVPKKTGRI
jgi:hypothetical protein